jgi:hypothetical protein
MFVHRLYRGTGSENAVYCTHRARGFGDYTLAEFIIIGGLLPVHVKL